MVALVLAGAFAWSDPRAWMVAIEFDRDPATVSAGLIQALATSTPWVLALTCVATWLAEGFGQRSGAVLRRLRPRPIRRSAIVALVGVALPLLAAIALLRPTSAGAARAVDASADSLLRLWHTWAVRASIVLAGVLLAIGWLERVVAGRAIVQALSRTPAQVRDDRRTGAG